jgi:regulatory protein
MPLLKLKKLNSRNYLILIDDVPQGVMTARGLGELNLSACLYGCPEVSLEEHQIDLIRAEISNYAWKRLLDWLALQERSLKESRQFLDKLFLSEELAEPLLLKAQKCNYINDERFAELYIESLSNSGKSLLEIKNKLFLKLDDLDSIEVWLNKYYYQQQQKDSLIMNLKKLLSRWQYLEAKQQRLKILNYLTRRGFSYSEIMDALADLEDNNENDYS